MLTIQSIAEAVNTVAMDYPIKRVDLFGSYADGLATDNSDVDVLVTFSKRPISILEVCGFQEELKERLKIDVDVVEFPVPESNDFQIRKVINLYER